MDEFHVYWIGANGVRQLVCCTRLPVAEAFERLRAAGFSTKSPLMANPCPIDSRNTHYVFQNESIPQCTHGAYMATLGTGLRDWALETERR